MHTPLDGKTALVTGANSGIGREISRRLCKMGCKLVLVARNERRLIELASELGENAFWLSADLSRAEETKFVASRAIAAFGSVDILVENAGIYDRSSVVEADGQVIQEMIDVNFASVVHLAKSILPHMTQRGSGQVLVIGSIAGASDIRDEAIYSASKHAVNAFVRSLRREVAPHGVRVGSILPGTVATELWGVPDPVEIERRVSSGDILTPSNIADIAAFMLQQPPNVSIRELIVLPHMQDI